MTQNGRPGREVLSIPDWRYVGLITYDAKDDCGQTEAERHVGRNAAVLAGAS